MQETRLHGSNSMKKEPNLNILS